MSAPAPITINHLPPTPIEIEIDPHSTIPDPTRQYQHQHQHRASYSSTTSSLSTLDSNANSPQTPFQPVLADPGSGNVPINQNQKQRAMSMSANLGQTTPSPTQRMIKLSSSPTNQTSAFLSSSFISSNGNGDQSTSNIASGIALSIAKGELKSPTLEATSAMANGFGKMSLSGTGGGINSPSRETSGFNVDGGSGGGTVRAGGSPNQAQGQSQAHGRRPSLAAAGFNQSSNATMTTASPSPSNPTASPNAHAHRYSFSGGASPVRPRISPPPNEPSNPIEGLPVPSVSAYLFGSSPPPGGGSGGGFGVAGQGKGMNKTEGAGSGSGLGIAVLEEKTGRGEGVLRRLSLSAGASGFGRPSVVKSPNVDSASAANPMSSPPPTSSTVTFSSDYSLAASTPQAQPQSAAAVPAKSPPSNAAQYMNPFSGFEYNLDDHHDDEHYHYENGFGGVGGMGAPLSRAKTIGGSGMGAGSAPGTGTGMTGWRGFNSHSRRTSENGAVTGGAGAGIGGGGADADGSGMRPRRISFGWTGFTSGAKADKPAPAPMKMGEAGGDTAAGGRGRSGSLGQGVKKRKVSPMGEHILRGHGHF